MTPDEAKIMREHTGYWQQYVATGKVLVMGPVADPEGAFGIAVIIAEDGEVVDPLCQNDPAIKSGLGFRYQLHVMPKHMVTSKFSS
jgi:uncharacterized protein YciI